VQTARIEASGGSDCRLHESKRAEGATAVVSPLRTERTRSYTRRMTAAAAAAASPPPPLHNRRRCCITAAAAA
jgi:hypothetical protein